MASSRIFPDKRNNKDRESYAKNTGEYYLPFDHTVVYLDGNDVKVVLLCHTSDDHQRCPLNHIII